MNVEEDDRLSMLPDELIHKILSFISIKNAIKTSVLSSRWRLIWNSMPYLNFSNDDFIPNFVSNLLSHRNNQILVSSVNFGLVNIESTKRVLNYTFSQNMQQLTLTSDLESHVGFPLPLFSSQSLKHLTMSGVVYASSCSTFNWDLPALTTLHLDHITLTDSFTSLFSKCTNLKNLILRRCSMIETNLVAPQLKNLTIKCCYGELLISTPGLTSLVIKGRLHLQLSTQGLLSSEKVEVCIHDPRLEDLNKIVCLFQDLHNVKFLTLNFRILERFSSCIKQIFNEPLAFANVKILKFTTKLIPYMVYLEVEAQEKETISTQIQNYDRCSMVSSEEIRVMGDIISTQGLLKELPVMLNKCKAEHMESHKRKIHEHGESQVKKHCAQSALELQGHFGEMMAQIKERKLLIKMPTTEICGMISGLQQMISWLQTIEELLTKLPASNKDVMQAIVSNLCEDAAIVMNAMFDFLVNQFVEQQQQ